MLRAKTTRKVRIGKLRAKSRNRLFERNSNRRAYPTKPLLSPLLPDK